MSHQSVRLLIRDVVKSLSDKVQFGYGRRSEFNLIQDKRYPYVWLTPLIAAHSLTNETHTVTWNVAIIFLDIDTSDAKEDQSIKIHDQQDDFVNRFINRLNDFYLTMDDIVGALTLSSFNQQPFYKDDAGVHTGWLLTFRMTVSDDFQYCVDENDQLYAGTLRGRQ